MIQEMFPSLKVYFCRSYLGFGQLLPDFKVRSAIHDLECKINNKLKFVFEYLLKLKKSSKKISN